MRGEPDLEEAGELKLTESEETLAMEPMKPMEGMKSMEPMKPMRSMRPMEMRMGNMQMSMGGAEKKLNQRSVSALGAENPRKRPTFCGSCGNKLSE